VEEHHVGKPHRLEKSQTFLIGAAHHEVGVRVVTDDEHMGEVGGNVEVSHRYGVFDGLATGDIMEPDAEE
jgi:hypothetical protein